jgi:hypothetical protein
LGHRLPAEVTGGLWQWKIRSRERAPRTVTRERCYGRPAER